MNRVNSWKSKTAAFMALAIATSATVPLVTSTPASAQLFPRQPYPSRTQPYPSTPYPQSTQVTIPAGISIPVRYDKAERIVVAPDETMNLTVTVATNIVNRSGAVLIPAGSEIIGQIQPVYGGSQFVARELVMYQRRQNINASSRVVSQTEEITRGSNTTSILKGAAIGAAAAAAVAAITGDRAIATEEVLGGAGLGALSGVLLGRRRTEVVVINPSDLNLTLNSNLPLSTY